MDDSERKLRLTQTLYVALLRAKAALLITRDHVAQRDRQMLDNSLEAASNALAAIDQHWPEIYEAD